MPDQSSLYPWWDDASGGDSVALRTSAVAWLEDPSTTVAIRARAFADDDFAKLKDAIAWAVSSEPIPAYDDPTEMEHWLRGVLVGCAASIDRPLAL